MIAEIVDSVECESCRVVMVLEGSNLEQDEMLSRPYIDIFHDYVLPQMQPEGLRRVQNPNTPSNGMIFHNS